MEIGFPNIEMWLIGLEKVWRHGATWWGERWRNEINVSLISDWPLTGKEAGRKRHRPRRGSSVSRRNCGNAGTRSAAPSAAPTRCGSSANYALPSRSKVNSSDPVPISFHLFLCWLEIVARGGAFSESSSLSSVAAVTDSAQMSSLLSASMCWFISGWDCCVLFPFPVNWGRRSWSPGR